MSYLSALANKIKRIAPTLFDAKDHTHRDLLSKDEVNMIRIACNQNTPQSDAFKHEVQHNLLGDRLSSYAGSGYEFSENRRYVNGDNAKFINWRLFARTGQLYRKAFHEERRPQVWIIVDRRASMRFGTRKRLKVTQAVIYAIQKIFIAQNQLMQTATIVLNNNVTWNKPISGYNKISPLIDQLISPCPPLSDEQNEIQLKAVLKRLQVQLIHGSIIYLISDFHDMGSSTFSILHMLSNNHTLHACHIIDSIEYTLPPTGNYQIQTKNNTTPAEINCSDKEQVRKFNEQLQSSLKTTETKFKLNNIDYTQLMSDKDIVQNSTLSNLHEHKT